jgi:hypothetical protein
LFRRAALKDLILYSLFRLLRLKPLTHLLTALNLRHRKVLRDLRRRILGILEKNLVRKTLDEIFCFKDVHRLTSPKGLVQAQ